MLNEESGPPKKPKTVTAHIRDSINDKLCMPPVIQIGGIKKGLIEHDFHEMAIYYTGRDVEIKREKEGD